jgi:hypothetical protein
MVMQAATITLRFNEGHCSHISAFPFWPRDVSARVVGIDVVLLLVYLFQHSLKQTSSDKFRLYKANVNHCKCISTQA